MPKRTPARSTRFSARLGGFVDRDLHLLLGADSRDVWRHLNAIEAEIANADPSSAVKTLILFYYSGHADGDSLELNDTILSFGDLSAYLKRSVADVRLAFLDSCRSGALVGTKGGARGPAFDIQVREDLASAGYAVVTSSTADELSQEAREIRGSYFTHYLVSGLRGSADQSRDGKVTLAEAYRHAYSLTVARTSTSIGGSQHPMYDFRLSGRGDIVLTSTFDQSSTLQVGGMDAGRLVIVDAAGETVVAEVQLDAHEETRLALNSGSYRAYWLRPTSLRRALFEVRRGDDAKLTPDCFDELSASVAIPKGGLFEKRNPYRARIGGLVRRFPLQGRLLSFGASSYFGVPLGQDAQFLVRVLAVTARDSGLSAGYWDLGGHVGLGYLRDLGVVVIRPQLFVGYDHTGQSALDGKTRHTSGFSYTAGCALAVSLGIVDLVLDAGAGGRFLQIRPLGWTHRLDLVVSMGLARVTS